ncbi:uncharacterized protein A4U43_C01F33110 [Asparagus officinalis]|uniref:Uncharacterized protein n=1 Tax=Asparagus officinalis TaxID=4686 RepID=A0A5P1FXH0_ASPOF|nr:uncharacterized protein A4U43_C01F33110 [Asparagus officinalis]
MDSIINSALEEICARGANGILVYDLCRSLGPVLSSSNLPLSAPIKRTIWNRLVSLPVLRFDSDGGSVESRDSRIECLDEAEGLGLRIVADEELRSSFVGLDDLNAANAKISEEQRRTLDRIAAARTNGITQYDLAKEFGIKGNNFFYQVRNLESQQLIVRQSITVRAKEVGDEVVNGQKNNHFSTNLIHLYRYGKAVNLLNSQQRIEITKPAGLDMLGSVCKADKTYDGDFHHGERVKEDLVIKDYLPAMKAVCDKLEEANEKILVVSDVKVALGYRKYRGHKAWRNIVNRLEDAGLVKRFQAEVNGADVECLRLLKKFDSNYFQSKPTPPAYDGLDSETSVKHGKRGHITDQFLELPMENCVYDMVDSEGPKGITVFEVCKRLGLNSKKMYTRIASMCLKFGMRMEPEKPNRTLVYRVWTPQNHKLYSAGALSGKCQEVPSRNGLSTKCSDIVPYDQSSSDVQVLDSSIQDEGLHSQMQKTHSAQGVPQLLNTCDGLNADSQVTMCCMVPQNLTHEFPIANDNAKLAASKNATNPSIVASVGSHLSASPTTSKQTPRNRSFASTMIGGRRKQWILERLKDDKFILHGELYRWLKDLETDKPTMMDRKTLDRTLNELQKDGLCRINQVKIPAVTNFSRTREQAVILHPSIDCISSDLLNEIYNSYKDFELKSHSRESGKYGNQPLTILTGIERSSNPVDDKPVTLEAMRANGYVQAKMVRAKLLHQYLWAYISSLPDWQNTLPSAKDDRSVNCHRKICQFSMSAAIQAMPLELFLQIVGSAKGIDDMVQRCRIGSRLMDLSIPEYKCVLDTHATARLSRIINILLLLKVSTISGTLLQYKLPLLYLYKHLELSL